MGQSIHYDGKLKEKAEFKEMLDEVAETCNVLNWHYEIFENELPVNTTEKLYRKENIFGMAFTPPNCETVWLCFNSYGKMINPLWKMAEDGTYDALRDINATSVETSDAGIETHKQIINLLNYLDSKYFSEFHLVDELNYLESESNEISKQIFNTRKKAIEIVEGRFQIKKLENERLEEYLLRVQELIRHTFSM